LNFERSAGRKGGKMAILDLTKEGIWGRCFKCRAKLEGTEEKRYGFCKECLVAMGVDLELA